MGAQVSLPQGIEGSALGMDSLPLDTLGPSSTINAKRLLMAVAVTGPSSEERLRFIERLSTVPIATSYVDRASWPTEVLLQRGLSAVDGRASRCRVLIRDDTDRQHGYLYDGEVDDARIADALQRAADSMEARLKLDSSRSTDQAGGSSCWPVPGVKSTIVDEQAMLLPSLAVVVEITGLHEQLDLADVPYPPAPTADPALHPWLRKQALKYLSHSPAAVLALTPASQDAAAPQVPESYGLQPTACSLLAASNRTVAVFSVPADASAADAKAAILAKVQEMEGSSSKPRSYSIVNLDLLAGDSAGISGAGSSSAEISGADSSSAGSSSAGISGAGSSGAGSSGVEEAYFESWSDLKQQVQRSSFGCAELLGVLSNWHDSEYSWAPPPPVYLTPEQRSARRQELLEEVQQATREGLPILRDTILQGISELHSTAATWAAPVLPHSPIFQLTSGTSPVLLFDPGMHPTVAQAGLPALGAQDASAVLVLTREEVGEVAEDAAAACMEMDPDSSQWALLQVMGAKNVWLALGKECVIRAQAMIEAKVEEWVQMLHGSDVLLPPAAQQVLRHAARGLVHSFISRAEDKLMSAARLRRTMPTTAHFFMQLQLAADESGRLEAFELAMREAVQRACQEEDVFSSMMATCLAGMPAANDSMLELLMQLLSSEVEEQMEEITEAAQQGAPKGMVHLEMDIYQPLGGRDQEAAVPGAWSGAAWGPGAMTAEEVMEKNVRMWVPDLTGSGSERLESYERQLMRRVSSCKREDDIREMLDQMGRMTSGEL